VRAVLELAPDKQVVVYLAHLPSPENHTGRDRRNFLLATIKDRIAAETDDVVLMGDLSTTVYSSAFQGIRSELKLQPAGYGIVPACSWHGYGPLLCLRIDHIFVSSGLGIVESSVAHVEGSDHRPVSATVTW
jgi:endonuclease/exonuclease/phosphatase family metal-dependent hydrolase